MLGLNLPQYQIQIRKSGGRTLVFDKIRKKFIALTPEEWVRQHFIHFLTEEKKVPESLISVEKEHRLDKMKKRTDLVIYGNDLSILMIVECKAPSVKITEETFHQVVRYNMILNSRLLTVTNGMRHYCCKIDSETQSYKFLQAIPDYEEMKII